MGFFFFNFWFFGEFDETFSEKLLVFFFFFNFFETLKAWTVGTCKKERGLIGQPFMSLSFGRTY